MDIKGYRKLTEEEIVQINIIKEHEDHLAAALDRLGKELPQRSQRWLALARTHLETGFLFAVKAVTRPEGGMGASPRDRPAEQLQGDRDRSAAGSQVIR